MFKEGFMSLVLFGDHGWGEQDIDGIEKVLASIIVIVVTDSFCAGFPAGAVFAGVVVAEGEG